MNYIEEGLRVVDHEIAELGRLRDRIGGSFQNAVEQLLKTLEGNGKIIVIGVGKSGNIAHKLCATLNSTGATSVVLGAQNALHGDLGLVDEGDAAIAFSYSGETDEVLQIIPHLKRLGIPLVAVTGGSESTLARMADSFLDVQVDKEACPLNLAPTASTTSMLVISDAIAMVLLSARGFSRDQFANLHPGGSIGRALLTRVSEIMRPLAKVACIRETDTVSQSLSAMSKQRSGASLIINDAGDLIGIFTHGDFARAYQDDSGVGTRSISELMTRDPIQISDDVLAVEAIRLLEHERIDDLPVVDAEGHAVGLVDTQDLGRLKLV